MKTHATLSAAVPAWISTLACLLAMPALFAQDPLDQQGEAYRASMAQSDVKRDAAAIQAELIELRDQMRQLMPDDVANVDRAIKTIQALSQSEMDGAISALQEASRSKDAKGQVEKIAGALKKQGIVSTSLKQLSVDLRARETLAGFAAGLSDLIRREVSVYREISRLGKIHQMPADLRDRNQERYQVAAEDQKGVAADLKLLNRKIELLAKDFAGEPNNGLVQAAAVGIAEKLSESADSAERLSASGPFNDATVAQEKIIRTLVAMQQALATGTEPLDRLRGLAERLNRAAGDQKEVMDAVMLIGDRQDLARNYKLMQSSLGDDVVAVRFEIEPMNNLVSSQLLTAEDFIGRALANYIRMWEEHMDARTNTQESHKAILLALEALKQQIAKLEATKPKTPAELIAALDQLQREVAEAALQQAVAAKQPQVPPANSQAMQARADDFQQRALPISPTAAEMLGDAAKQVAGLTPESQAAGAESLAEAARELAKQKAELAALANAQAELAKAQELTEKAEQNLENKQTAAAANALNAAAQAAKAAQKDAAQAAPEAAEALAQAVGDLAQANMDAAQTKTDAAQAKAEAAGTAMAEAQAAIGQAMAQTPGMAPMPMGPGTAVSENAQGQGKNPESKGNGSGGPTGDNLVGAGAVGALVEAISGLNPKDREAIAQFQKEKPPREFAPEVQQYYKNLADGAGL